jgi:Ser/Thr protein kinase RdoA (MazF antagonist)
LTFNIEARINKAYESLHELGIVHGDVHPDHILVLEDGSIRIIDFDCAFIVPVGYDKLIDFEEEEINNLLRELKGHKHSEIGD